MRAPVVAIAVVFGAAMVFALGSIPACVVQPQDSVDAGLDGAVVTCDVIGASCDDCQRCGDTQTSCAGLFKNCQHDPDCVSLSRCFDDTCDIIPHEKPLEACVATCCMKSYATPTAIKAYEDLAACVFMKKCPESCNLQHIHNTCKTSP